MTPARWRSRSPASYRWPTVRMFQKFPMSWGLLGGLKTLVLDMLRPQSHPTHFSTEEAVSAAEKIAAEQTFFTHMTHDISHAALELPAGMALAHDGLVLS